MSQESERPEPTNQATPANIPQVKMPSVTLSKDEVQRFFNEATKYTIFGIFILYSIGFLIWHSYLAEYGVSSFEFLQAEYFSATICYLIFLTMFALPAALLYMVLLEKKKIGNVDASTIVFIWSTISYQFLARFFPNYLFSISSTLMNVISIVTALTLGYVILYGFLTINLHFKWTVKWGWKRTPEAMRNLVGKLNFVTVSVLAIGIIYCFSIPELSKPYLIFSLFLYPVLSYGFEMGGRNHWNEGGNFIKILIVTFCALVIVGNIQLFGAAQFGKVSRQMGGGKSETAYVRFAPQYLDLPTLLNIPIVAKKTTCGTRVLPHSLRAFVHPSGFSIRTAPGIFCRLNNGSYTTTAADCTARLGGAAPAGGMLAVELDAAGPADGLPVLPAVAGLHPGGGRAGLVARRHVVVDALAQGVRPALYPVRAGVVAV